MSDTAIRAGVVAAVALAAIVVVWLVRRYVDRQRRLVIAASASRLPVDGLAGGSGPVRILAFSSDDCRQCHTLQAPALQRVLAQRGDGVQVVEVDAPSAPELVEQYRVLTLPTTVVLDATGRVHAVNYGFANTWRLLEQVDRVLENATSQQMSATGPR
jgi:hypothetical protein